MPDTDPARLPPPAVFVSTDAEEEGPPWQFGVRALTLSLLLAVPGAWLARRMGLGLSAKACTQAAGLGLLLLSPVLEEYLLRSGLQRWLQASLPFWLGPLSLANGLCALVFGLAHALLQNGLMLCTMLPALWLGWLWEQGGQRLIWPVLGHALFNAALLVWSCQV